MLRTILPKLTLTLAPDVSIGVGVLAQLSDALKAADVAILCAATDPSPWLHLQAGVALQQLGQAHVMLYTLDVPWSRLPLPLSELHVFHATNSGTLELLTRVADSVGIAAHALPTLATHGVRTDLRGVVGTPPPLRTDHAILEDLMLSVQGLRSLAESDTDQPIGVCAEPHHVPSLLEGAASAAQLRSRDAPYDLKAVLDEIERAAVMAALQIEGTQTGAARVLGLTFRSFRYLLKKHQIQVRNDEDTPQGDSDP
jgi:hypothetical protein